MADRNDRTPFDAALDALPDDADSPHTDDRVIGNGVYRDGRRIASPASLDETYRVLADNPDALAWIGLSRPAPAEIASLAAQFGLHELAVEDAITAHQRPKVERYGKTLFVVLRAATYHEATEEIAFAELHVFLGRNFAITVRHGDKPQLARVRERLENESPELLALGSEAVLYAIMDAVVDDYLPVLGGLENDIDEIETQVFDGESQVSKRIYQLSREVIEFQRAVVPLQDTLNQFQAGFDKYEVDLELRRYLRDVADHVTSTVERLEAIRHGLREILQVNATLVAERQNDAMARMTEASMRQGEDAKKVSSWAAILFAPSIISGIYGMNFHNMPELATEWGYPIALCGMIALAVVLFVLFRRRGWL